MTTCIQHKNHPHQHNSTCGHTAVAHQGHTDYLHDGHLHHVHKDHVDEHVIEVSKANPERCVQTARGHDEKHVHGPKCGHESIPHGNHVDYLVGDQLHHVHDGHCDDHGKVKIVSK